MRRLVALALGMLVSAGQVGIAPLATDRLVMNPIHLLHVDNAAVTSTNWSGYAVADQTFTGVQGAWNEPTGTCTSQTTAAAFWVGIDGYDSDSVEQLGSSADCTSGVPSYYAWYEMYPAASVELSTSTYPVAPGDQMEAEVLVKGTSYKLAMRDISSAGTTKWTFVTNQTSTTATDASAEWVSEAPSECLLIACHVLPLTHYSTVTFKSAEASSGGAMSPISSFSDNNAITMETSGGTIESVPSSLTSNGESFTTSWEAT
jgi:Peptidase A4 family